MQNNSEVLSGLVVGHKRDGRCRYDPEVKQELVRRCMVPGVSVARMAMQHGINANLLRLWIMKSQGRSVIGPQSGVSAKGLEISHAFVPVQIQASAAPTTHAMPARLSGAQSSLLIATPAGLTPAKQASLRWTHESAAFSRRTAGADFQAALSMAGNCLSRSRITRRRSAWFVGIFIPV